MRWKPLISFFLTGFLLCFLVSSGCASTLLIRGSNIALNFKSGESLGFQGDYTLLFEVNSGFWNATGTNLTVYDDNGVLCFLASNNSVLEVSSPDASTIEMVISGANYTKPSKYVWLATILTNATVVFQWNFPVLSWLDLYFMFGVGMSGLILMVFAPSWVAYGVRRNAFQPEKIERVGYAVLLFCVGFGLFMSWLVT